MNTVTIEKPMRTIIMGLLLCFSNLMSAQPGFIKVYDESLEERTEFEDVLVDNDTIVLYGLGLDDNGDQGIRFVKIDTLGNVLFDSIYVDTNYTLTVTFFRKKIIKTSDGGYAMLAVGNHMPHLLKVHHDLSLDFIQKYPSNINSSSGTLLEVADGYLLTGHEFTGDADIYVIKTDKQGNQLWRKRYGLSTMDDASLAIKAIDDNSFIITGGRNAYVPGEQPTWGASLIIMIDSIGEKKWEWVSDLSLDQTIIWDFKILPDSSWICISMTWELSPSGASYWTQPLLIRMDKDFNLMWQRKVGLLAPIQFWTDLEKTPDGNYLASGWMYSVDTMVEAVHYKFSAGNDSLWLRTDRVFPDSPNSSGSHVIGTDLLSSGSIISVGYAYAANNATYGFVMKISPEGCIDTLHCWPVASHEPFAQAPKISVYPNPADDELIVQVEDYPAREASIFFYDLTGRFLMKRRLKQGRNGLNTSNLPSGMIFYSILTEKGVLENGKLVKN